MKRALAWTVHLYTASSAVFGLWGLFALFAGEIRIAIFLILLTLAIDSTDGALARWVGVREQLPWFDGRRLDDICDYFTYVILPACFMVETQLLPNPAWAALPVLASAYGFSRDDAKTEDHFFLGWPSYWNILAIYLFLFQLNTTVSTALIALCAALVFVPLRYVYPSRTRKARPITLAILVPWMLGFSWIALSEQPPRLWLWVSLLGPAWYYGLSLALHLRPAKPAD